MLHHLLWRKAIKLDLNVEREMRRQGLTSTPRHGPMSYIVWEPCEIPQITSLPYLILHVYCPHARTSEPVSFCLFVFYQQVRVASFKTLRISKTIIRIEMSSLIASVSKKTLATSTTDEGNVDALGRKLKHNLVSTCCTSNGNPIGISIMSYIFNFKSCVGLVFSWKASQIHANDCKWWILMVILTSVHGKTWQNQWSRHLAYSNGGTCVKWHRRVSPCLPSMFTWALQALDSDYLGMSRNIRTWQGLFWAHDWKLGFGHWGSTHK